MGIFNKKRGTRVKEVKKESFVISDVEIKSTEVNLDMATFDTYAVVTPVKNFEVFDTNQTKDS